MTYPYYCPECGHDHRGAPCPFERPTIVGGIPRESSGHSPEAQRHYDRARQIIQRLKASRPVTDPKVSTGADL